MGVAAGAAAVGVVGAIGSAVAGAKGAAAQKDIAKMQIASTERLQEAGAAER